MIDRTQSNKELKAVGKAKFFFLQRVFCSKSAKTYLHYAINLQVLEYKKRIYQSQVREFILDIRIQKTR